jgi:hypothetical protein
MRKIVLLSVATLSLAAMPADAQSTKEDPVAVRVNHLPHHVRDRVHAKAEQGITALARWLELTRTVYQLRLMDVVADYDRSSFGMVGDDLSDRQVEDAIREGRARPIR